MPRYEFREGTSRKFWEIALEGASFTLRWGRIGTQGQSQVKTFAGDAKAQAEHDKLVREKLAKGYREVGGAAVAAPAPKPQAAPAPAPAPPIPSTPAAPVAPKPQDRKSVV